MNEQAYVYSRSTSSHFQAVKYTYLYMKFFKNLFGKGILK